LAIFDALGIESVNEVQSLAKKRQIDIEDD